MAEKIDSYLEDELRDFEDYENLSPSTIVYYTGPDGRQVAGEHVIVL